jgi:hypothetical protein
MAERPMLRAINTLVDDGESTQASPQPKLCMSWAVDPMTGKPSARWVATQRKAAGCIRLNSAA